MGGGLGDFRTHCSSANRKGTEGNLKRNKRDGVSLYIFVVYWMKVSAAIKIQALMQTYGPPYMMK
jgi:hypothetical protein